MHRLIPLTLAVAATAAAVTAAPVDRRLIDAVKRGDSGQVELLLKQRADVDATEPDGSTALLWATYRNDSDIAQAIVAAGANVNTANMYGETALALASQNGNLPVVNALLRAGADAAHAKSSGETVLMTAARSGHAEIVKALVAKGALVNAREPMLGQTALMWAAAHKHAPVVGVLIDAGANVDAATSNGSTALHFAVQQADIESARILISAGADVHKRMSVRQIDGFTLGLVEKLEGLTPLLLAITDCRQDGPEFNGSTVPHPLSQLCPASEELGILLLQHGANPNESDGSRIPVLHQAVHAGMAALASALVARGATVNARVPADARQWKGPNRGGARAIAPMPTGASPFFVAAWWHRPDIMRQLLEAGADPHLTADDGTTPLMAAAGVCGRPPMGFSRQLEAANLLETVRAALQTGEDINAANVLGQTAMHGAAMLRSNELIQFLADNGARIDASDKKGETPLSLASRTEKMADRPGASRSTIDLLTNLAQRPVR